MNKRDVMKHITPGGFEALQYPEELEPFVGLLREQGVRKYLEVGTCNGGTFHRVLSCLRPGGYGVAVDLPHQKWGKPGSRRQLEAVIRRLRRGGKDVRVIWGNSRDPAVIQQAAALAPYDAVFIDGDHSLEGVTADWRNYGPMARIVAFHDIACHGPEIAVPQLWEELKATRRHVEIVCKGSMMGIGVLWNE